MKLVKIENFKLSVADEALLIKPIRRLWNADRSGYKEHFYQQMSYIYHMVDPRSGYTHIVDEELRRKAVLEQEGLPSDFKVSEFLQEAMDIYKKQTATMSQDLLNASLIGAAKVSEFLKNVDLTEEDDKGRPKYQVSSITSALKNVEGIVSSLQNLQRKVDQELEEKGKARGTQELTLGDRGLD
jgi:hypothetical protein